MSEPPSLRLGKDGRAGGGGRRYPEDLGIKLKWTVSHKDLHPPDIICQTDALLGFLLLHPTLADPLPTSQGLGTKGEVTDTCVGLWVGESLIPYPSTG